MNQHDQMRNLIEQCALICDSVADRCRTSPAESRVLQCAAKIRALKQTLAAEPAPLVRLTDDDFEKVYLRFVGLEGFSPRFAQQFANAIMDAMERVNGRQLDQTPNSPSE